MTKTRIIALLGASAVVGTGALAPAASAETITLRMHTFIPPVANPAKTFLVPWTKRIEKASKGQLKVQPFWTMQLGGRAPQLLDQARDGVVDIVWTLPGFTAGRMPRVEVFELPFVHKDPLSTTLALQDFQAKYLAAELKDYHPLLLHVHAGTMFMTKKPVLKMSDLKGMKLRAASRAGVWQLAALGASPVGAPLPQIPPMLSKGVIDGALLPFEIAPAVKMQELVSHFTQLYGRYPRMGTAVFTFLMNKKKYDSLPANLRKVIDDNSGRNIARWAGQNWAAIEAPGRRVVASKKKNKFHTLSKVESDKIRKASEVVFARWFAEVKKVGIDGPALLRDARAMIAKYSR